MSKHWSGGICVRVGENQESEVLLVCEASDEWFKRDFVWSLPGGKCCDYMGKKPDNCPETPEQTVVREFREETGYTVEVINQFSKKRKNSRHRRFVFIVKILDGEPLKRDVPDGISPAWFSSHRLPSDMIPYHQKILSRFFGQRPPTPQGPRK